MKDHLKPRGLMLALAVVVLASGGGVAYATSSHGADSTIHGCYSQSTGQLRIDTSCRAGELAVSWSSQGQPGPQGPTGPTGPQGPKGDNGATGAQGSKGDPGAAGSQGAAGPQGTAGQNGQNGQNGNNGNNGNNGSNGSNGSNGGSGTQGPAGPAGPTGTTGATGATGAAGVTGAKGDTGDTGAAGPQGQAGAQGLAGPQGPQGAQGVQGPQGPAGAQGPAGPSDAYTVNSFVANATLSTSPTAVASLSLDPGSYVFMASARLFSQGTGTNAQCYVQPAGGGLNSNFVNVNLGTTNDRKIVALNYAATFSSATTMNFNCQITAGDAVKADEVFFTAIKVGAVTQQ